MTVTLAVSLFMKAVSFDWISSRICEAVRPAARMSPTSGTVMAPSGRTAHLGGQLLVAPHVDLQAIAGSHGKLLRAGIGFLAIVVVQVRRRAAPQQAPKREEPTATTAEPSKRSQGWHPDRHRPLRYVPFEMFATPAILALLFFVYVRPQEIFPPLARVPLLYLLVLLALVGLALDFRLGYVAARSSNPLLPWIAGPPGLEPGQHGRVQARHALQHRRASRSAVCLHHLPGAVAGGADLPRAWPRWGWACWRVSLFIVFIGLHQAFAPLGCVHRHDEIHED